MISKRDLQYSEELFCEKSVAEFQRNPQYNTLKLLCFNKNEADKVLAYMRKYHPDIPLIVSRLVFE